MAENKTQATDASVDAFLGKVEPEQRRADGRMLLDMMTRITGEPPVLWGPSIIGFGTRIIAMRAVARATCAGSASRRARHSSCSISPPACPAATRCWRSSASTRLGKGCLYITKLADVDLAVLEDLIAQSWAYKSAQA